MDTSAGLTFEQVKESTRLFGENTVTKEKTLSFAGQFLKNLNDPIIRILIGAMVINVMFMFHSINWPETVGIGAAVIIAALVSTVSEYGSEKAFDKLNRDTQHSKYTVLRQGETLSLYEGELVCGDVIYLTAGEIVPADCTVIKGELTVNESLLTGESRDVIKRPKEFKGRFTVSDGQELSLGDGDKIFKGCLCQGGECTAVIGRVGDATFMGTVAKDLQKRSRPSPLKERLSALAKTVSHLGYIAAGLIMAAYLFNVFVIDSRFSADLILMKLSDIRLVASSLINAVTLGVSVIVVAVPEGLPMMITVVLSSNMKKMLKSGVLVRKPVGIETAGSMNILFTDKTGTLTKGEMTVTELVARECFFESARDVSKSKAYKEYLIPLGEGLISSGRKTATEKAVHSFCKGVTHDRKNIILKQRLPFDSKNKYSACTYSCSGTARCYVLGAAEKLLDACDSYTDINGEPRQMDVNDRRHLSNEISSRTRAASRVMALVQTRGEVLPAVSSGRLPSGMTFVLLVAIKDELRDDIKRSVREVKGAGVQVVMITGDNRETAVSVATEAGIIDRDHDFVLTGEELARLSDETLMGSMKRLAVVARALPSDKLRLVELSGKMGLVSGMTGDGINDAPSLKNADVGFAMGSGIDVAKEASDIILINNSFHSIAKAILYGRCVFESIRKFITFQLTMNLCAMGVSLLGPFISVDNPITVIQMLWVNIIMDTLGGLAFAGEIPLREYMKRPPISKKEKILTGKMASQLLFLGGYTLALCIAFLKLPLFRELLSDTSDVYFLTCFFALFIFCGIFNSFNARSPRGKLLDHLSGNKAFIGIISFVAVGQLAIIYFGGQVFRTVPLTLRDLCICGLLSLTVLPVDAIRKLFMKKKL